MMTLMVRLDSGICTTELARPVRKQDVPWRTRESLKPAVHGAQQALLAGSVHSMIENSV